MAQILPLNLEIKHRGDRFCAFSRICSAFSVNVVILPRSQNGTPRLSGL